MREWLPENGIQVFESGQVFFSAAVYANEGGSKTTREHGDTEKAKHFSNVPPPDSKKTPLFGMA